MTSGGFDDTGTAPTTVLELVRSDLDKLISSGVFDSNVLAQMKSVQEHRSIANEKLILENGTKEG